MRAILYTCAALVVALAFACVAAGLAADSLSDKKDIQSTWTQAENIFGVKGEYHADGTATFDVPRDLTVTLNGIGMAPGSDLSHEIRMMSIGDKAMAVGELVLTQDEIDGVTRKLLDAGIEETALHNHILHESPGLMYLHFHAYGDPVDITTAINDIITPLGKGPEGKFDSQGIDTARLDRIMGSEGKADGGVYGFSHAASGQRDHGRDDTVALHGHIDERLLSSRWEAEKPYPSVSSYSKRTRSGRSLKPCQGVTLKSTPCTAIC